MPIFMQVEDIKGDVIAKSHSEWIEIDFCNFAFEVPKDDARTSDSTGARKVDLKDFRVGKSSDRSDPLLMEWLLEGSLKPNVRIDVCSDVLFEGSWRCLLRYQLKDVKLSDFSLSMRDGEAGKASLTLALRYQTVSVEQISYDHENERAKRRVSPVIVSRRQ